MILFTHVMHLGFEGRGRLILLGPMCRVTIPPTGIFSAGAGSVTRDMTVPLAAVISGNLGVFQDASIHLSDPYLFELKQTFSVRLSQWDHCSLDTIEAFVESAGSIEIGSAQL